MSGATAARLTMNTRTLAVLVIIPTSSLKNFAALAAVVLRQSRMTVRTRTKANLIRTDLAAFGTTITRKIAAHTTLSASFPDKCVARAAAVKETISTR